MPNLFAGPYYLKNSVEGKGPKNEYEYEYEYEHEYGTLHLAPYIYGAEGKGPKIEYDYGTLHLALYIYGASANDVISLVGEIFREDNGMLLQFLVGNRLVLLRSFH